MEYFATRLIDLQKKVENLLKLQEDDTTKKSDLLLIAINELQVMLEELKIAQEELVQQGEELSFALNMVELERQRFLDLFENAPEGYIITDLYGKFIRVNQAAVRILNVNSQFLLNSFLVQFIPYIERKSFRQKLNQLRLSAKSLVKSSQSISEDFKEEFELVLHPRDGEPFHALVTVTIAPGEGKPLLRWSIRSIEERFKAVQAIQDSEARFRALAESTSTAIFLVDSGLVQYANPTAYQIVEYPPGEIVGLPFVDLIHPDDRRYFLRLVSSILSSGENNRIVQDAVLRTELRAFRNNKGECWIDLSLTVEWLDNRSLWIVSAIDITAKVMAERIKREFIQSMVTMQEDDRRRIARELHDQMGQELTALTLGFKNLEDFLPENSPGLAIIHGLAQRVNNVGQEVHRLSLQLRPTALDDLGLGVFLENYVEEWSENHGIKVDYEANLPQLKRIPGQVSTAVFRIIQEAFTNILKHAQASHVSVILNIRSGHLQVVIEDNGQGFDPEAVSKNKAGTQGLGLLGMTERADLLGGKLKIETAPGKGTTLYISIPISDRVKTGKQNP